MFEYRYAGAPSKYSQSPDYKDTMMQTSDLLLGRIVQHIYPSEAAALSRVWGCTLGWDDELASKAVLHDGYLAGGSGRFSRVIKAK